MQIVPIKPPNSSVAWVVHVLDPAVAGPSRCTQYNLRNEPLAMNVARKTQAIYRVNVTRTLPVEDEC